MRAKAWICLPFLIGLFAAGTVVFGHHSMAMFDATRMVTFRGIVTKFAYTNPHINVYVNVEKDGKTVNYWVEGGSPHSMKESGWSPNSLKVGDRITVLAHPTKANTNFFMLVSITKANGTKLTTTYSPEFEPSSK